MGPEELIIRIEKFGSFAVTKDTPKEDRKSLNKLKAYDLVQKRNKHSWELSSNGYLAIEKGGLKNYLDSVNEIKATNHIENYSVINGDKNVVNQRKKSSKEEKQKKEGFWSKFWWLIIIPLLIGILLIIFDKNIINF